MYLHGEFLPAHVHHATVVTTGRIPKAPRWACLVALTPGSFLCTKTLASDRWLPRATPLVRVKAKLTSQTPYSVAEDSGTRRFGGEFDFDSRAELLLDRTVYM